MAILAVVFACRAAAPVGAQSAGPDYDPAWHGGIAAGSLLASGLMVLAERGDAPKCRWCGVAPDGSPRVPRADDWARSHWRWVDEKRAGALSHVTLSTALAWPLIGLTVVHGGTGDDWANDQVVALDCIALSLVAGEATKRLTLRTRPDVVFDREPITRLDDVHSFFSSHAATAFGAVAAAGTIASRRRSADATWIWIGGLALAGSTSYLRVAADRHHLTDVIAGAAAGTAIGMLLPRAFDGDPDVEAARSPAPIIVGIGPARRIGAQAAATGAAIQVGAGARSLGLVGTVELR